MLAERKIISADADMRAHLDLVYANAPGSQKSQADQARQQADSRRIEGLAKNAALQNGAEQRHFQILRDLLVALGGDHEVIHGMLTKWVAAQELDREQDREAKVRFEADVMELLMQLRDRRDF